eukprot:g978.t1
MRNHWKAEHAREHGGLPEGTKKLSALASGEKLRVERLFCKMMSRRTRGARNCDGAYTVHHRGRCSIDPKLRYCTEEHAGPKYLDTSGRRKRAAPNLSRRPATTQPASTRSARHRARARSEWAHGPGAALPITTRRVQGLAFSRLSGPGMRHRRRAAWHGASGLGDSFGSAGTGAGESESESEDKRAGEGEAHGFGATAAAETTSPGKAKTIVPHLQPMALSCRARYTPTMCVAELLETHVADEHAAVRLFAGTPSPQHYDASAVAAAALGRHDSPGHSDGMGGVAARSLGVPLRALLARTGANAYARETTASNASSSFHTAHRADKRAQAEQHRLMALRAAQRPHETIKQRVRDLRQNQANVLLQLSREHVAGAQRANARRAAREPSRKVPAYPLDARKLKLEPGIDKVSVIRV